MWFAISCWCRDIAWSSCFFFFFSSRRRHTRLQGDWSSDVCSSDLLGATGTPYRLNADLRYRPPTAFGLFYFGGGFAYFHASGGGEAGGDPLAGRGGRRGDGAELCACGGCAVMGLQSVNLCGRV